MRLSLKGAKHQASTQHALHFAQPCIILVIDSLAIIFKEMKITIISIIGIFFTTLTFGQVKDSLSKAEDPIEYIRKESIGGKLDFKVTLEKEKKGFYLYDGIAYNQKDFAIFLWGQAVKRLGIPTRKKASKLWEEINKRELTKPEKNALTRGFNMEIK
jgi:hypothetical protein